MTSNKDKDKDKQLSVSSDKDKFVVSNNNDPIVSLKEASVVDYDK